MDARGDLYAQIMRLSQQDRLALIEDVMAASLDDDDGDGAPHRAALRDALAESARDLEAGRTRPAPEVLAKHWPR